MVQLARNGQRLLDTSDADIGLAGLLQRQLIALDLELGRRDVFGQRGDIGVAGEELAAAERGGEEGQEHHEQEQR
ncbi:hypothetical protein D3C72_2526890 [compost metagenome]